MSSTWLDGIYGKEKRKSKSKECAAADWYDFRPKVHGTNFNYPLVTFISKLQNSVAK